MIAQRTLCLCGLFLLLTGCAGTPFDREAVRRVLPPDVKLDTVAETFLDGAREPRKVSVETKLMQLRAHVAGDKLVDDSGREIRFFHLTGCWGAAPVDYQKILDKQQRDIEELKKDYTVVTITCNPSGLPVP
jgi:hypothetical protein